MNSFKTKFDDSWVDTTNFANYANVTHAVTHLSDLPDRSRDELPAVAELRDARRRRLQQGDAEDRRDHVPDHRRAAHRRDHRGAQPRRAGPADCRQRRVPQSRAPVGRLERRSPLRRRRAAALAGTRRRRTTRSWCCSTARTCRSSARRTGRRASASSQQEHNYFTTKNAIFQWFAAQFERMWHNSNSAHAVETVPFVPLPPATPIYKAPVSGSTVTGTTVTLVLERRASGRTTTTSISAPRRLRRCSPRTSTSGRAQPRPRT